MKRNKPRTYYKNFHKGFTKDRGRGMTRGDVRERLGCIKAQVFKWDDDVPITVRALREILGRCGYYLSERTIRYITNEGQLKGIKLNNLIWCYTKKDLCDWVNYLIETGHALLVKRGIIKEERDLNVLAHSRKELIGKRKSKRIVSF